MSAVDRHGHSKRSGFSPTYKSWRSMRDRCNRKNVSGYARYGGLGIKVCKRWEKFSNFLKDMGERPDGHTLDRIDNTKNYSKSNCRWANSIEQAHNRRKKPGCASKYIGVVREKKKWGAKIRIEGKHVWLGTFNTQIEAAAAYNKAAISVYGDRANLNKLAKAKGVVGE